MKKVNNFEIFQKEKQMAKITLKIYDKDDKLIDEQ